jgi:MSHA biogenesis protein MshJ
MAGTDVAKAGRKSSLADKYRELNAKFLKQSRRDQILILVAALVVVIMPLYMYGVDSAKVNLAKAKSTYNNTKKELSDIESAKNEWMVRMQQDPNESIRKQIEEYGEKLKNLDKALASSTVDLVPAFDMPGLLQDMLSAVGTLKLLSIESIPPMVIVEDDRGGIFLYRHGTKLVLEGGYLDVMKYLQVLENLSKKFIWGNLSYEVREFPKGTVTIEVYTLSNSKDFISG